MLIAVKLLRISGAWLACSAGLLACCAFLGVLTPAVLLAGIFLLGTGFAVQAPVASASIPEIVGKEELPSAIALGGIQMNLAGIIGPALGGLLIPFAGVSVLFAMNAIAFAIVLVAVTTWKRKARIRRPAREIFRFARVDGAKRYHPPNTTLVFNTGYPKSQPFRD